MIAICEGMARQHLKTVLVLPEKAPALEIPESDFLKIVRMQLPAISSRKPSEIVRIWRTVREMRRLIRVEGITVVHANEILDFYAPIAAKLSGVKCCWNVRAELSIWPVLNWALPRMALRMADRVVVASHSVATNMFGALHDVKKKLHVIYDPGFDLEQFQPKQDVEKIRSDLGVAEESKLVVLVAKIARRKGHPTMIKAAPQILKEFPKTRFVIVGGEVSGRSHRGYPEELRQLIAERELGNHVHFAGFRSDIADVMNAADVLLQCSTYPDPFPGVVLQGMSLGKPVIATRIGGAKEQIVHESSGILVEPGDETALANAVVRLLKDEELGHRLGAAAKDRIASAFRFAEYDQQWLDVYTELTNQD